MRATKVRKLAYAEVAGLKVSESDTFLVPDSNYQKDSGVLVAARLKVVPHKSVVETLKSDSKGTASLPTVYIATEYGVEYNVQVDHLYTEVEDGQEGTPASIVETVGSQVSMTVYAPGMDGPDVLARMHKALRDEFGVGVLQLRQQTHRKAAETGLPTVLGVPDNAIPRLI